MVRNIPFDNMIKDLVENKLFYDYECKQDIKNLRVRINNSRVVKINVGRWCSANIFIDKWSVFENAMAKWYNKIYTKANI